MRSLSTASGDGVGRILRARRARCGESAAVLDFFFLFFFFLDFFDELAFTTFCVVSVFDSSSSSSSSSCFPSSSFRPAALSIANRFGFALLSTS
ncbi:hypothetical protein BDZ91DRAFT_712132 [Kalaharituber pfeilii]|nr:hypothetical protein BDZ91DRAFT_712132 [Kalaharituber pfeilii]